LDFDLMFLPFPIVGSILMFEEHDRGLAVAMATDCRARRGASKLGVAAQRLLLLPDESSPRQIADVWTRTAPRTGRAFGEIERNACVSFSLKKLLMMLRNSLSDVPIGALSLPQRCQFPLPCITAVHGKAHDGSANAPAVSARLMMANCLSLSGVVG
jgi:hypothetical protein